MNINADYPCNPKNHQGRRVRPIAYLVIHYVGALGGARANALHYHNNRPGISAHYFVGHASEGAAVYLSVPEDCVASHCGRTDGKYKHPECRNANSVGIELCCHQDKEGRWYFDTETVDRAVELTRMLMDKYQIDADHVIRHYDVTGKICPAPFVKDAAAWERFKERLGEANMTKEGMQAIAREEFRRLMGEYEDAQAASLNRPVSPWALESWDKAKEVGALDGTRPNAPLTREQYAVTLDRLGLLKGRV